MTATSLKLSSALSRAASAYRRAARTGKRYSWLVDEAVEVHPDEIVALRGACPPGRFRWRGKWRRVQEVTSIWRDGRKRSADCPGRGRTYVYASAGPEGFYEMYYDRVWMIYRKIEIKN